jgi:hypothetical protein
MRNPSFSGGEAKPRFILQLIDITNIPEQSDGGGRAVWVKTRKMVTGEVNATWWGEGGRALGEKAETEPSCLV